MTREQKVPNIYDTIKEGRSPCPDAKWHLPTETGQWRRSIRMDPDPRWSDGRTPDSTSSASEIAGWLKKKRSNAKRQSHDQREVPTLAISTFLSGGPYSSNRMDTHWLCVTRLDQSQSGNGTVNIRSDVCAPLIMIFLVPPLWKERFLSSRFQQPIILSWSPIFRRQLPHLGVYKIRHRHWLPSSAVSLKRVKVGCCTYGSFWLAV